MARDLTYINKLLLRYGIYVYDKDMGNMLKLMEMEIKELYSHGLISKEEYIEAVLILKRRKEG
ncbi:YqgQ family protein [Salinicoccus roseus]|uniref:YqgQ family protein n=1 Tax=Salinicoccus roseus TaxID=45670 RepID=UPI0023001BDB|nr:YqgQ family protein [Salinicoccus roseus]